VTTLRGPQIQTDINNDLLSMVIMRWVVRNVQDHHRGELMSVMVFMFRPSLFLPPSFTLWRTEGVGNEAWYEVVATDLGARTTPFLPHESKAVPSIA